MVLSPTTQGAFQNSLNRAEAIVKSPEVSFALAGNTLEALHALFPIRSKQGRAHYRDFCLWAFAPRPTMNGLVPFEDCALDFSDGVLQIPIASLRNRYNCIPASSAYRPNDTFCPWFRQFPTTTVAGVRFSNSRILE